MLVDLEWFREYIDIGDDPKKLAHRLTMSGVEVEGIDTQDGETVLDVSVTPNRGDCLSMVGLAREISAITGAAICYPATSIEEVAASIPIWVELENKTDCPRYAARYITGVRVSPSSDLIRRRLEASGIRSINNIVDATNYVMLELGHPLHPFDADRIVDKTIVVRSAHTGEKLTTLDGVERTLEADTLVIADPVNTVALAGVMGGQNTEVGQNTTNILLESAYFKPSAIRRTSSRLGFTTEASYRFERGCDPDNVIRALDRAALMIVQAAGGEIQGNAVDSYPTPISALSVNLRFARLKQILGLEIPADKVVGILERLGLVIQEVSDEDVRISIPPFRPDLTREIDLIEEVARINGYEHVPATLPSGILNQAPADESFAFESQVRTFLAGLGFFEGINFTFTTESNSSKLNLGLSADSILKLKNPLNAEQDVLRTSLIPSLLENLANNLRWNCSDVKLFEISSCYKWEKGSVKEEKLLAGIMAGRRYARHWKDEETDLDFYDVKGVVEAFCREFGIINPQFAEVDGALFHPGRCLQVLYGKEWLGFLGELSPEYELPGTGGALIFELDLSAVLVHRSKEKRFTALRKFPGVSRDLAVVVPDDIGASQIFEVIETFQGDLLEKVELLNIYTGSQIEEGHKSMAFSLLYQSPQRTLVDEEVDCLHNKIAGSLQKKLRVKLR
jgi:phenylalanyl-tRNA synthetase beta chain